LIAYLTPVAKLTSIGRCAAYLSLLLWAGCPSIVAPPNTTGVNSALLERVDGPAIELSDALEALIATDKATVEDRAFTYSVLSQDAPATAADALARAMAAARMAQLQGIDVADHIAEVEVYARQSAKMNPNFRDGAALRTLGTLYVLAPGGMTRRGDAEKGLEILQTTASKWPNDLQNRLRLAEAFVTLDEVEAARKHLCWCLGHIDAFRPDEQAFLRLLVEDADIGPCR
jgi:hypothetical protein